VKKTHNGTLDHRKEKIVECQRREAKRFFRKGGEGDELRLVPMGVTKGAGVFLAKARTPEK